MLRPIAAGLMCLGFVTLSVAISQGQDEDLIVIDGQVQATEVNVGEANGNPQAGATATVEGAAGISIEGGGDANVNLNGQAFRVIRNEDGGVVISNADGRIVEKFAPGPEPGLFSTRFGRFAKGPQVIDPQTREMLDKLISDLKEQVQKLQSEGKQQEAQQKMQSLQAVESLLHGNAGVAAFVARRFGDQKRTVDEMHKLHARLNALVEESSKLPEGAAGERDKINQEIEKVKKEIVQKDQSLAAPFPMGGQPPRFAPGQPFPPGAAPPQFTQQPPGPPHVFGGGFGFTPGFAPGQPQGFGAPEHMAMLRKVEALSDAAAQLKKNGLDEQAQPLLAQAKELKAKAQKMMQEEAEKQRSQAGAAGGFGGAGAGGFGGRGGFGGFGFPGGGPPMDLHNALRELQEQIQQLRKEVGELRELLQRKPAA